MLGLELRRHAREFARLIRTFKFERHDGGLFFPSANANVSGVYSHRVNGGEWSHDHNILPDEGLTYMLDVAAAGGSQLLTWYLALYATDYTPTKDLTAATFAATTGEITSGTEGYAEPNRVQWQPDATDPVSTDIINEATPATFTIVTATNLAVNGAGLLSSSAKGGITGKLISAGKFSATRNFVNGDEFNLKYKLNLDQA